MHSHQVVRSQGIDTSDAVRHASAFNCYDSNKINLLSPCGQFTGHVSMKMITPQIQIMRDHGFTRIAENLSGIPENRVCITLIDSPDPIFYDGRMFRKGMLHVCSGETIQLVARNYVSGYVISIDKKHFNQQLHNSGSAIGVCGKNFERYLQLSPEAFLKLKYYLDEMLAFNPSDSFNEESFSLQLFSLIFSPDLKLCSADDASTRGFIVNKSCKTIMKHFTDSEFSIGDLIPLLRTSRRSVQYSFQDILGMNPSTYLRYIRLNVARASLLSTKTDQINQIAIESGFSHVSRFSQYYRDFFGELPSQTLKSLSKDSHFGNRVIWL